MSYLKEIEEVLQRLELEPTRIEGVLHTIQKKVGKLVDQNTNVIELKGLKTDLASAQAKLKHEKLQNQHLSNMVHKLSHHLSIDDEAKRTVRLAIEALRTTGGSEADYYGDLSNIENIFKLK